MGVINVSATLAATVVAVLLALRGFGVWALVWRELVRAAAYAAGTWSFCGWRPVRPRFDVDVRSSLRFGADLSAFGIVQYFSMSVDRVLLGRFYGPTPLGLYTKAVHLAMMPIEHIRMTVLGVGLAPLSALNGNTERYRQFYGRLLSAMSFVYMPVVVFLVIESENIVLLLLGEGWLAAAPLLRVLTIAAAANPLLSTFQLVLISSGKSTRYLHWGVVNAACLICAYLIGIHWGAIGVACACAVANYVVLLWSLWYCFDGTPIDAALVIRSILLPVAGSVSAGAIRLALGPLPSSTWVGSSTLVSLVVITAAYVGLWFCLPVGRRALWDYVSYCKELTTRQVE
jgi:PST family polysaccharide transporter